MSFTNNGYEILPDAGAALLKQFPQDLPNTSRAGARHLLSVPEIASIARALAPIAGDAIPFRATLFNKASNSNWSVVWHQDTALPLGDRFDATGWGPWSIKAGVHYAHAPAFALENVVALRLHLDDSTADNGPLRVLPGTHVMGVLSDDDVHRLAQTIAPVDCLVPAGGVLMMRPLLIHSSGRLTSTAPRRVLHIEYAESLMIADGIELAIA